ncbi:IclR family transcriptional regulator C-terminal domain-containing protein [Dokdonella sp.]|jgi:IclR family pca regulon transcriptional regulator|uniref:IclR family transcriptional regulator domain-containing protein n=1 Tax=Dokdonella sp. TaxID=2291710 RepID=UPI002DD68033|nr:IclR family transcriptional regulator C-terminal domain-containing protein [Dokdonella sp.]
MNELAPRDWIAGLEKGLRLIEAFSDSHPRLTPSTAARRAGITRTAARRYLLTLHHLGYLDSDGSVFWLTPKILRLGWSYFDSARLPRTVQPFLQRISVELGGASTFFSVLDGNDLVFVARNATSRFHSVGFVLGTRVAPNLASAGIALLACRMPAEVEQWLVDRKFPGYTTNTLTEADDIRQLIAKARDDGYAIVDQQLERDRRGIAVSIRSRSGELVGAISVGLSIGNETQQQALARALPLLREAEHALLALL